MQVCGGHGFSSGLPRRRRAQGSVLMDCVDPRVSYNELVQGEIEYDADSGRPIY